MKLLYLVLKNGPRDNEAIEFESSLPIYTVSAERHWCAHFQDHLNNVFTRIIRSREKAGNTDEVLIHAVIVDDNEAKNILLTAELRRNYAEDLDLGTIDPKKMCILGRIFLRIKNRAIVSIESNSNLHPAYQNFFEKECIKLRFLRQDCFKIADLEHETQAISEIEKTIIETLAHSPLEILFRLEANSTTLIPISQMLKDFIDYGPFRQSTKATLVIVFLMLKLPFQFHYEPASKGSNGNTLLGWQLLATPNEDFMNPIYSDCLRNGLLNKRLLKRFYPILQELLSSPSDELSKFSIRKVFDCAKIDSSDFLLQGVFNIVKSSHEEGKRCCLKIFQAHQDLLLQSDIQRINSVTKSSLRFGTEVFPLAARTRKDEMPNDNKSLNCN